MGAKVPATGIPTAEDVSDALKVLGDPDKAKFLAGYFKTGRGEYGEGDRFLGITVPVSRQQARRFRVLPLPACVELLQSPYNEVRLVALLILMEQYRRGDAATQEAIYACVMQHRGRINNWNLVDTAAPAVIGPHLLHRKRDILFELAASDVLWDRRIAVLASFAFIRAKDHADTLRLCKLLLSDTHDLMHKACGWMLREVGIRDRDALEGFIRANNSAMPRTMLRYAIEKFPPEQRKAILKGVF